MRAPVEWIRHYAGIADTVTVSQIAHAYTRLGLEIEDIHEIPATRGPLVVGRVLEIEELTGFKKPIRYTQIDVGPGNGPDGSDEPRGIICGAQNFAVGDAVVISLPGAVLPGGFEIAARKTYGHISDGMICSARELGIGDDHDGIIVLDPDAEPGTDARALIGADDAVIEFSITPDRGYALSIRGLARELAAAFDTTFTDPAEITLREARPDRGVEIVDTQRCSRFVAVGASGVDPAAPSPWRIRRRLMAAGIRSISLAVDVTNYVMLELGHPLHAFDAAKLDGGIVVRRAAAGETLRTLDGSDRTLTDDDVVVADQSKALSVAGVMGGEESEISAGTTDVVIEAACWDPTSVARTVRRLRLPSEAARRYERAVDPAISAVAAEMAASLLTQHGGGALGGRTNAGHVPDIATIVLPAAEAERLAGRFYTVDTIIDRLTDVGCEVDERTGPQRSVELLVAPPSWRPDLTRPADLVEEVARLEGYDTIVPVLPAPPTGAGLTADQRRRRRVADDLAAYGLTQVVSFPFAGDADFDAFGLSDDDDRRRAVRVANPLDQDRPYMATTLLTGLATTALRNLSRGATDLALFEVGQVARPGESRPAVPELGVASRPDDEQLDRLRSAVPHQPVHVAALLTGQWERSGWWGEGRAASLTDILALARRIADSCGVGIEVRADDRAPWHPGRCAALVVDGLVVGHAGELHPEALERLGLPSRSLSLEIDLDAVSPAPVPIPPSVSPFPPVNVDVALVVDEATEAGTVAAALREGGGELLESVRLFDIYTGDQVGEGCQSLAFALVVRAADRTLTGAEATAVRDAAVEMARQRLGAELRG